MKVTRVLLTLVAAGLVMGAQNVFAAGAHDMNCVECHNPHFAKGDYIIGVQPGAMENPSTTRLGSVANGIDALCLGCHNEEQGIIPIHLGTTHPTGVEPTYVNVPSQLLRNNKFTCISCHNPHPSNVNYKYLIAPTNGGKDMGNFCAVCHPEQSDPGTVMNVITDFKVDPPEEPRNKISQ